MSPPPHTRKSKRKPQSRTAIRSGRTDAPTQARLLAMRILERVERTGAFADLALNHALARVNLSARDRALVTDLVYGTLRWRGRLDFMLTQALHQPLDVLEPLVVIALRFGAYQILFCDRIPATAAVDQSVRCVRAAGLERATGLVNAVLRKLIALQDQIEFPDFARDPVAHLTHALSLPHWLAARWIEIFGVDEALALAQASNAVPPLTIRANPRRTTRAALLNDLRTRITDGDNIKECRHAPLGIALGHSGSPGRDPAFLEGRFSIQDEASQLVVVLLDPQPGDVVLDTCAAPGTKTTAIAEQIGETGHVLALDRHPRRLELVARDARRLGLHNIETLVRDATTSLEDLCREHRFARILVDAPCSGLGTLRRNPDARWRIRADDPAKLAKVQAAILRRAAECLKPGGVLVYSTCTVLPEENDSVVGAFLEENHEFRICARAELPAALHELVDDAGWLRCLPHHHGMDGFTAVRLQRSPK